MIQKYAHYTYDSEFDILSLSTKMDYEESATIAYDLMANFDTQGHCMGFEFLDAAYLFLPYLCPDKFPQFDLEDGLTISYSSESDTLSFHNSEPVGYSEIVVKHCIAHLGSEGDPVGFTLEKASELVLPLLLQCTRGKARRS